MSSKPSGTSLLESNIWNRGAFLSSISGRARTSDSENIHVSNIICRLQCTKKDEIKKNVFSRNVSKKDNYGTGASKKRKNTLTNKYDNSLQP